MNLSQARLISAVNILLGHDERLVYAVFSRKAPVLCEDPREIIKGTTGFSHGERFLVRAALDLWNGSGGLSWIKAVDTWDNQNLFRFLHSILYSMELEEEFVDYLQQVHHNESSSHI